MPEEACGLSVSGRFWYWLSEPLYWPNRLSEGLGGPILVLLGGDRPPSREGLGGVPSLSF